MHRSEEMINKRAYRKYPELIDFREWMLEQGVFPHNATYFLQGANEFQKSGADDLKSFKQQLKDNGVKDRKRWRLVQGAGYYLKYLNNEPIKAATCDEDCFNCKYPDCIMP